MTYKCFPVKGGRLDIINKNMNMNSAKVNSTLIGGNHGLSLWRVLGFCKLSDQAVLPLFLVYVCMFSNPRILVDGKWNRRATIRVVWQTMVRMSSRMRTKSLQDTI